MFPMRRPYSASEMFFSERRVVSGKRAFTYEIISIHALNGDTPLARVYRLISKKL